MRHLTADDLVDLVEGMTKDADVSHLAECPVCRQQLADLRAAMTTARNVEVPEPPPFFWTQFSARVRDAVASEATPHGGWWRRWSSWPGVTAPLSAAAAAVIVFFVVSTPRPTKAPPPHVGPVAANPRGLSTTSTPDLLRESAEYDDASLELVAELTDSLGWDAAADSGLAPNGSAEHAVTHLSLGELQQLEHLLQEGCWQRRLNPNKGHDYETPSGPADRVFLAARRLVRRAVSAQTNRAVPARAPPPAAGRRPKRIARRRAADVRRLCADAGAGQLKISDDKFAQFLTRYKALQEVREKPPGARAPRRGNAADAQHADPDESAQGQDEGAAGSRGALRHRRQEGGRRDRPVARRQQQAKFRVFEEAMERRKLELVTRARQANRAKAKRLRRRSKMAL